MSAVADSEAETPSGSARAAKTRWGRNGHKIALARMRRACGASFSFETREKKEAGPPFLASRPLGLRKA
jgi:hypothetical protein